MWYEVVQSNSFPQNSTTPSLLYSVTLEDQALLLRNTAQLLLNRLSSHWHSPVNHGNCSYGVQLAKWNSGFFLGFPTSRWGLEFSWDYHWSSEDRDRLPWIKLQLQRAESMASLRVYEKWKSLPRYCPWISGNFPSQSWQSCCFPLSLLFNHSTVKHNCNLSCNQAWQHKCICLYSSFATLVCLLFSFHACRLNFKCELLEGKGLSPPPFFFCLWRTTMELPTKNGSLHSQGFVEVYGKNWLWKLTMPPNAPVAK